MIPWLLFPEKVEGTVKTDIEENEDILSQLKGNYEIVYPVQIRKNEVLPVDTHDYDKSKVSFKSSIWMYRCNRPIIVVWGTTGMW